MREPSPNTTDRVQDEIDLWQALDLDVYCKVWPGPRQPIVPEQLSCVTWRFTDPTTGQWTVTRYAPDSDTYGYVNSSPRQGVWPALARLTEALEAQEPSLEGWDFEPVDRTLDTLGRDRFVLGHADVELGSTMDWAETFLIGLTKAPDLIHRFLDAHLKRTLLCTGALLERGVDGMWGGVDAFHDIEPRAGMDIVQVKRDYAGRLVLIGNVDCSTVLVDGPRKAVWAHTKALIHALAPGGGYLLSTSNSVHPGVEPEYYLTMLDTAREVGVYPIC